MTVAVTVTLTVDATCLLCVRRARMLTVTVKMTMTTKLPLK